jgi:hypothetical protein
MDRFLERAVIGVCAFGGGFLVAFSVAAWIAPTPEELKDTISSLETERNSLRKQRDELKTERDALVKRVAELSRELATEKAKPRAEPNLTAAEIRANIETWLNKEGFRVSSEESEIGGFHIQKEYRLTARFKQGELQQIVLELPHWCRTLDSTNQDFAFVSFVAQQIGVDVQVATAVITWSTMKRGGHEAVFTQGVMINSYFENPSYMVTFDRRKPSS